MLKKFISHTLVYGLANQLPKVLGLLVLPVITHDLTEEDFGIYGIVLAYASALEVLTTLGLRIIVQNTYYRYPGRFRRFWEHLYGFLILWMIPYGILHFIVIWSALSPSVQDRSLIALLSTGASLFFSPVAMIGSSYYQFAEKPVVVASIGAVAGMLGVLLNLYFISFMKWGYLGWFWSSFITAIGITMVYFGLVSWSLRILPRVPFSMKFIRRSLKISLPTLPHFYSMFLLNSSDRMLMNMFNISTENIGRYNVAYTVGNVFQSIAMASGFAITPLMLRCYQDGNEAAARRLVFFLQAMFLATTFVACLWMKEIFDMLIRNEALSQMYYLGIIIVMSFNYRPIYYGAVNRLIFLERTSILWQLTFIPGVINVLLNIVLLPRYGYEVAAISTFVTFSLMGLLGYGRKGVHGVKYYSVYWTGSNVALTAVAYLFRDMEVSGKVLVSLGFGVLAASMAFRLLRLKSSLSHPIRSDELL